MEKILLKNSAWLLSSQTLIKVIAFFYTLFLARSLGVDNFGLYITAMSFFSLVSVVGDLGINRYLIRELALNQNKLTSLMCSAILFRLTLLSVTFAILTLILFLFDHDLARRNLTIMALIAILPQSLSLTIDASFIALNKVKYSAYGALIFNVSIAVLGVILISLGYGPYGAITALIIGQVLYVLVLVAFTFKEKIDWLGNFDEMMLFKMIKGSIPYGLLGIMGLVYFKIDTILISYLRSSFEAGIYGAAYKFLEAIVFVPATLALVIFPFLAKLHEGNTPEENLVKIKTFYPKIILVMGAVGIVTAMLFITILPFFIKIFLPAYLPSIAALQILSLAIPFMFIHVPLAQILTSSEKYLKAVVIISLIPLSFNLITNIILIPKFGYMAAAWITVFSDVISLGTLYFYIRKSFR